MSTLFWNKAALVASLAEQANEATSAGGLKRAAT